MIAILSYSFQNFTSQLFRQMGAAAKQLDGTGWACVSVALVVFGWFFLKGSKIRST
jgi:hypothetical protein